MARTKLEETFNLPAMKKEVEEVEEETANQLELFNPTMHELMERADKIDRALPEVSGIENEDRSFDEFSKTAMETFEDLVDLGKSVEDRFASEIFQAASNMMGNAITAKTNKVKKKLEMVKLQIRKANLEFEKEKLEYLKARHIPQEIDKPEIEATGHIVTSRSEIIQSLLDEAKKGF